ncbi:hypothetical protein, partial [Bradyrhizobium sp. CW10]|uniref:hypothetical protein n=1 Tax=Bradyrhizobium sp. CW10 TaxID=2782683 RepID=UPI001FFA65D4
IWFAQMAVLPLSQGIGSLVGRRVRAGLAAHNGNFWSLLRITATLHQGIRRMDAMSDALLISLAIWGMIGCAALRVLALLG